jgi:hypothetical protein
MINHLLAEEEQRNAEFVTGQIDRNQWADSLRSVDERLSVLGIRLVSRPWETVNSRATTTAVQPSTF